MKEIEQLKQIFEFLENSEDVPFDRLLDGVPDESETLQFIEWMKTKPEVLQAIFLFYLTPYRKDCVPRLVEFSTSANEEVSLVTWETLLKIEEYYDLAKNKIINACLNEIKNHAQDKRVQILGCLRDGLSYVAEKEGIAVLKHYRDLALENNAATIVKWLNISISGYEREPGAFDLMTEKLKSE